MVDIDFTEDFVEVGSEKIIILNNRKYLFLKLRLIPDYLISKVSKTKIFEWSSETTLKNGPKPQ
jgi:hypothetical protein